ncbi:hypothetical protein, partial [Nocardiopsis trehalosi]|uniref:hypothetical protein n=1 Tax=Nocardiopsis trehalosi TaxID=109329 RepID=UPI000835CA02
RERGHADAVLPALLEFTGGRVPEEGWLRGADLLPPWLGDERVHRSHRRSLADKDPVHYGAAFAPLPEEPGYVWPRPALPRGLPRRCDPAPLPVDAALAELGWPDPPAPVVAAVRRLAADEGEAVVPPDPRAGLLAGLCTPDAALWLVPGAPPPCAAERGPRHLPDDRAVAGTPAASAARPPGPEDRAAVAAECATAPAFRFRRRPPEAPVAPPAAPTGLVVLSDPTTPAPAWARRVLRFTAPMDFVGPP